MSRLVLALMLLSQTAGAATAAAASDDDLAAAIRTTISTQPDLKFATIGVTVTRGVAQITGEVERPSQKTRAFLDALAVNGIVGVDAFGVTVRPRAPEVPIAIRRDDTEIYNEVAGEIGADVAVGETNTTVSVRNGVVRLSGTYHSLAAKLAAENDALLVRGVRRVVSDIVVHPLVRFSDKSIGKAVEQVLRAEPELKGRPIVAQVKDSTVVLHGRVSSAAQWLLATRDVARVPGIVALRNQIEIAAGDEIDDATLKKAVDSQIDHDPLLSPGGGNRVDTVANQGVVIITGSVVSITEFTRALLDAFQGGAKAVWNQVKIQSGDVPGLAVRYFETYPGEVYPLGNGEPGNIQRAPTSESATKPAPAPTPTSAPTPSPQPTPNPIPTRTPSD